jgi:hypothetical protein
MNRFQGAKSKKQSSENSFFYILNQNSTQKTDVSNKKKSFLTSFFYEEIIRAMCKNVCFGKISMGYSHKNSTFLQMLKICLDSFFISLHWQSNTE